MIHGKSQVDRDANELQDEWIETLNRGLAKSGLVLPSHVEVVFPYYAKLLDSLINNTGTEQKTDEVRRSGTQDKNSDSAQAFTKNYLIQLAEGLDLTAQERAELNVIIDQVRDVHTSIFHSLLGFLERKSIFSPYILRFIAEVNPYLTNNKIKKQINDYVMSFFDNEPCVVVGHSLGTIVGYLTLKDNSQLHVREFITLGSPLGLKIIKDNLEEPLVMPTCIKGKWFNAYDKGDTIALYPLDRTYFNIRPLIENRNDIQNKTQLPDNFPHHGIKGYLDDEVIAKRIYDALVS